MAAYQCPDCLGVHEEATEPLVGLFVRCESCLLEALIFDREAMHDHRFELEAAPAAA